MNITIQVSEILISMQIT